MLGVDQGDRGWMHSVLPIGMKWRGSYTKTVISTSGNLTADCVPLHPHQESFAIQRRWKMCGLTRPNNGTLQVLIRTFVSNCSHSFVRMNCPIIPISEMVRRSTRKNWTKSERQWILKRGSSIGRKEMCYSVIIIL